MRAKMYGFDGVVFSELYDLDVNVSLYSSKKNY